MKSAVVMLLAIAGWQMFLVANSPSSLAGTKMTLGRAVPAGQQVSMDQIAHEPWNRLLARYVNDRGFVDYPGWKASAEDARMLDQYLESLARANPAIEATRTARLAFWINAYNAVTVRGILREYPTTSIRNHTAKLIGYNIWDDLLLNVGGRNYSLNQIEHEVLRKMGEPRIHFAIVCASHGCPRLLNKAYMPETVENQLAANARDFFANPLNFQYDSRQRTIRVSSILDWFGEDFGNDQAEQMKQIAPYLPDDAAKQLASSGAARVSYLDYDWSLNDQATKRTAQPR
jgi:hypothetical protein